MTNMSIIANIDNNIENLIDLSCNHITAKLTDVGYANIESTPTGAKIYIDSGETGTTPAIITLPVGVHTFKLTHPGYTDIDGLLFINLNGTYPVSVIMTKLSEYFDFTKLLLYTLTIGGFAILILRKKEEPKMKKKRKAKKANIR